MFGLDINILFGLLKNEFQIQKSHLAIWAAMYTSSSQTPPRVAAYIPRWCQPTWPISHYPDQQQPRIRLECHTRLFLMNWLTCLSASPLQATALSVVQHRVQCSALLQSTRDASSFMGLKLISCMTGKQPFHTHGSLWATIPTRVLPASMTTWDSYPHCPLPRCSLVTSLKKHALVAHVIAFLSFKYFTPINRLCFRIFHPVREPDKYQEHFYQAHKVYEQNFGALCGQRNITRRAFIFIVSIV